MLHVIIHTISIVDAGHSKQPRLTSFLNIAIHTYTYTCMYNYKYTYTNVWMYKQIYIYMNTCVHMHICYIYLTGYVRMDIQTCVYIYTYTYMYIYVICVLLVMHFSVLIAMGWLRSVGSIKLQVSFAEQRLFYRTLWQKRPIILSIVLTKATPYVFRHKWYHLLFTIHVFTYMV